MGFLSLLALLAFITKVKGWVQICDETMKYCNSTGGFNPIMDYTLFEGQISLFDTGFFIYQDETRSAFLNTNLYCSLTSYTQKQRAIQSIFQIGNIENRFDENENPDNLWYYTNGNSQTVLDTFVGNVIPFQTCAYVLNMAYLNGKKSYNFKRYTISIEYQQDILKKKTVLNLEADYTFNQLPSAINHEDFPCGIPQITFHPGINALMYMMDDQKTIVVKADRSFTAGIGIFTDMCTNNFLMQNQAQISQFSFDIKAVIEAQLAFKVRDTLKNWVFLNGSMYLVAYGYQLDFGSTTEQSMIVKVNIVPTSNTAGVVTVVNMTRMFGFIDQIASLELMGFVYTVSNSSGIYIGKVNIQTFSSMAGFASPTSTDKWKLYQTKVDNHPHRPIFAVPLSAVSKLYRVTTRLELLIDDASQSTDFYNFNLQVARYRALTVNTGTCSQTRTSSNYNNLKAVVLNLRRMEVERCIDLALTGCGDGKMSTRNGETCDDGNLENGDGCSNQCTVEYMWSCTQNEGQLSVCTPITCGNGKLDPNEECDDFNFLDNDGCTKCEIDLGYKCLNTTCSIACGDGKILRQYRNDPVTNTKTLLAYNEECDFVNGCNNATCKPLLGWTCTVNNSTLTSYCNQTCGNNKHDLNEVCDDGNNVGGDGCAEGCLKIEIPYTCPLVGACSIYCGNGEFDGNDTSIGIINGISPLEECDDGNNVKGDGCSDNCIIEPGWRCRQVFQGLKLEIPSFKSQCTKITNDTTVIDTTRQFFRNVYAFEYTYTQNVVENQTTGKFRLIEHPTDMDLYGVTFVASGNDKSGSQFAYEYTKVKQKVGGSVTYYETKVDMKPTVNVNQEAVTRNTFGPLYIKSTSPTQLSFFTYIGTQFLKFFTTQGSSISRLLGTPEVYWWPKFQTLMVRKIDGSDWKTYRVNSNVVDVAMNPQNYVEADQIESGANKNDMRIGGLISVEPLFSNQYMLSYSQQQGASGGTAQILKYYDQIDYLGEYNEKRVFSESNTRYFAYSLIYIDDDFGAIFKSANSSLIYRLKVPSMESTLVQLNPNGFFSSENIAFMTFIQRRDDPWADPTLQKDVYGYFDSKQVYRFIINPVDSTEIITVEAIDLPKLGLMIQFNRMIDVGLYQLAVYSGVQCNAVKDISTITGSSAWFYTFSTKSWTCMDLANDPVLFDQSFYGWSVITPPVPTPTPTPTPTPVV